MASEMGKLLESIAEEQYKHRDEHFAVLRRRLLPLLEAGADMRYQEWPVGMAYGPAKDWDDALVAAKKG